MPTGQKPNPDADTTRPSNENLPKQEKQNEKLVIVSNISQTEIESILTGFCNMYNKESFQAQPRLFKLNDRQYAITFPFDIEFEIYCYFINYVRYPMGFDKSFDVTAWEKTKQADGWITEKSANKNVMLFIPEDDNEHDNVFLTTEDNIGYKLGFAVGEEKQLLETPKKGYSSPTIDINTLTEKQATDFK
ncbi:MAG: hypothetical protein WC069_07455 [Candidatus Shapirobacteria bacterium]